MKTAGDRIWIGVVVTALGVAASALDWPFGWGMLVGFGLGTLVVGLIQHCHDTRKEKL